MSLFDRSAQRALLDQLIESYPVGVDIPELEFDGEPDVLTAHLAYLEEHGLIEVEWIEGIGYPREAGWAAIKAKGIDFLADDGGLSAILGVVTVKLHSETIRDLLIARVSGSDEPETVKGQVIAQLKATPTQALGQLTERALDAGLRSLPNIGTVLQGLMG